MKRTIIILLFCLVQSTNDSSSIEWMNSVINQRFLNISKWKSLRESQSILEYSRLEYVIVTQ